MKCQLSFKGFVFQNQPGLHSVIPVRPAPVLRSSTASMRPVTAGGPVQPATACGHMRPATAAAATVRPATAGGHMRPLTAGGHMRPTAAAAATVRRATAAATVLPLTAGGHMRPATAAAATVRPAVPPLRLSGRRPTAQRCGCGDGKETADQKPRGGRSGHDQGRGGGTSGSGRHGRG
jgi:hypothetical protein